MYFNTEFLSEKRQRCDMPADAYIEYCFADSARKQALFEWMNRLSDNSDLMSLPGIAHDIESTLFEHCLKLPDWATPDMMNQGSAFFVKYSDQVMQLLGLLSLPYCYAAANGARVLALSRRLTNEIGKRLHDTGQFIWDVMDPDAFSSSGKGFLSILKTRLIHAAARFYSSASGDWNQSWGLPVNQEDMAGTNLAFSLIVIRGLRKIGYSIALNDQKSFLHLWNVVGSMLGIDKDLIPQDGKSANQLEHAIRVRQFKMSSHGAELTKSLAAYFGSTGVNGISQKEALRLMRYFLGAEVSSILSIPEDPLPVYFPIVMRVSGIAKGTGGLSAKSRYLQNYQTYKNMLAKSPVV